jgi:hypothetical protein
VLKQCAANRKRRLSELPNVGPYIYIYDVKISGFLKAPYIYDISRLRDNIHAILALSAGQAR